MKTNEMQKKKLKNLTKNKRNRKLKERISPARGVANKKGHHHHHLLSHTQTQK
jgi:hypothetical protein